MRHLRTTANLPLLLLAIAALLLVAACSDDDDSADNGGNGTPTGGDFVIPADMEGTWEITDAFTDCDSGDVIGDEGSTETEVLCAGEAADFEDEDLDDCTTTTLSENSFRVTCSGTTPLGMDCNLTFSATATYTMGNTSFSATGNITMSAVGTGCPGEIDDMCMNFTVTGTRTGDAPAGACEGKSLHDSLVDHLVARALDSRF